MEEKQIINPNFQYGQGDDGTTQAKNGQRRLPKWSAPVKFYNEFEKWVSRLVDAHENLDLYNSVLFADEWLDGNRFWFHQRVAMFKDVLEYLKDNAYVLGALAFTNNDEWQLDGNLLDWMRLEIKQMEEIPHNFVTPNRVYSDLAALENLRLQTRTLESYLTATIDLPNVNASLINRYSSYVYIFTGLLRTSRGEQLNLTDWSCEKQPKFTPKRTEAKSNND
mgnify:CR=1 FL=1